MGHSESMKELLAALIKAAPEFKPILKNKENSHTKARYADLDSIIEATREVLLKHGIFCSQQEEACEDGRVKLHTKLFHAPSGEWMSSSTWVIMPTDGAKIIQQEFGKSVTYQRRYSLSSILGVTAEEDTDAEDYGNAKPQNFNQKGVATEKQIHLLLKLLNDNNVDVQKVLNHYGIPDINHLPGKEASALIERYKK